MKISFSAWENKDWDDREWRLWPAAKHRKSKARAVQMKTGLLHANRLYKNLTVKANWQ